MFTNKYKECYIHGYCDKKNCSSQIGMYSKEHKTYIGAQRYITKMIKKHSLKNLLDWDYVR